MQNTFFTYLIAFISGVIGVFAFSPFDYWGLAYLSLLGLLFVVKTSAKKTALWGAFYWGLGFFTVGVHWLHVSIYQFGGAPLFISYLLVLLLSAYLALYPVLFAYLVKRFQVQSVAMFPILWTLTEYLRGWMLTGFPWLQFGYTQIDSPVAGIAPLFGVEGLTFFVMWVSAALLNLLATWRQPVKNGWVILANGMALLIVTGLGVASKHVDYVQKVEEKSLTITLAQGNIEQNLKWEPEYLYRTLAIYQKLIAQQLGKSEVIILPESALPILENQIQPFFQGLQEAAQQVGTEVMIGTIYQDTALNKLFNSIVALGNRATPYVLEQAPRYNKHHLVPFGEYVPLEGLLRPLGHVFNLPMSAFQAGEKTQSPLIVHGKKFTPAICYEIILGEQLRQNLRAESDFILTVSNDAWFGDSIGPWQHLQMARMRALELGKPVIRATNTGITAFIDEKGEIVAQAPQFLETTLTHRIAPTTGKTPYSVLGDTPLYTLAFLLCFLRVVGRLLMRRFLPQQRHG